MLGKNSDVKISDIIKKTLEAIEKSRSAIFDIAENARNEVLTVREELRALQDEVRLIIDRTDYLELASKRSMSILALVNKDYANHSQEEMQSAYELADKYRIELAINRERESQGIIKRNELEMRLKNSIDTVNRADQVVAQVGAALGFLSGDLSAFGEQMESADNKRILAIQVLKAHEEERSRISREIHDGPAQAMSNVVLKAEIIEKLFDLDIAKTRAELTNLKTITRNSLQDVRRIIYDLRPMSLDDLGLKPTLIKYVESFMNDFGIVTELVFRGDDRKLENKTLILTVFRVIQECLANIRKHSGAKTANITLEFAAKQLAIRIRDDGKGFDVNQQRGAQPKADSGFGLFGLKERVDMLDGTVEFDSAPNKGTIVRITLPYEVEGG